MTACDLCGKQAQLFLVSIEETELHTCESCAKHGKVLRKPASLPLQKKPFMHTLQERKEVVYDIVDAYASIIKKKRESMQLTQDDFAKQLNERVTILQKIESGAIKPTLALAKKLESILHISLIEEKKEDIIFQEEKKNSDVLTIGDFIKIRKKS